MHFGGTGNAKSLSRKAGETAMFVSNSSVLLRLEFSLLVLGMTVQDLFLPAVGTGELVELVHLLTGVIKSVEDSLPEKCQSSQPQWGTALRVRNPAVCFSSNCTAGRCSDTDLLACDE